MKYAYLLLIVTQFVMYSQEAPQPIDYPELGVKFIIPMGWTGQEQGDVILLGHQSIPGMMFLFGNTSEDVETMKKKAMEGIHEGGIQLQPKGNFTILSETRTEGNYEGTYDGVPVTAFAIGLINKKGSGLNILILTETKVFTKTHILEANKLADSVKFFTPKDSDKTVFWKNRIVGTQLKYMYTSGGSDYGGGYSGISDVVMINLCSNGQFTYYSNSHSSFDSNSGFGNVNSNENNQGLYKIYSLGASAFLELTFENGKILEYNLSVNNKGNTLLDNTRYFVVDLEGCE